MIGKHQRILTEDGGDFNAKLNAVTQDILVRVGDETNITEEFILTLLSEDRKAILVNSRQFTVMNPEEFKFEYEFKGDYTLEVGPDNEGKFTTQAFQECREELNIPVPEFPVKPYADAKAWKDLQYKDIPKKYEVELPRSGKTATWELTTVEMEGRMMASKKKVSSHTQLEARKASYLGGEKGTTPMVLTLDNEHLADIEAIRRDIMDKEAKVDTVVILSHPHKDKVAEQYKYVHVDLLSVPAFFFPSQAI